MSKKEQRLTQFRQEAENLRQQAEAKVTLYKWDLDPVKQYVRRDGWLKIIKAYIKQRHKDGVDGPIKYLTLPGPNASDIGYLSKNRVLGRSEDGKLNVAICDKDHAETVTNNLLALGGLLAASGKSLISELESTNGILQEHFPFDVINLDFCDCLIPSRANRGLDTVEWIFKLQRGQSFLLLLTTKPDEAAKDRLLKVIRENLRNEKEFSKAYQETYGNSDIKSCLSDYVRFTQIVFPKAMASFARDFGYSTREHFAARYTRIGEKLDTHYDMVCHSFEFTALGRNNPSLKYTPRSSDIERNAADAKIVNKLGSRTQAQAAKSYGAFVKSLPKRDSKNVLEILKANSSLEAKLDKEARSLLMWWEKP
jgi:hypothetical protein